MRALLAPIFLLHRSKLNGRWVERGHFQIHATIRANDNFTNFGSSRQLDLEVTGLDPATVELAPMEQEDWGE